LNNIIRARTRIVPGVFYLWNNGKIPLLYLIVVPAIA